MDVVSIGETMVKFDPDRIGRLRTIESFHRFAGGAENNTMIGLSRLGYKSKMISFMGDDEFGRYLIMCMSGEGVDVSHIKMLEGGQTGIFFVERNIIEDCKSFYYRSNSAMHKFSPDYLTDEMFGDAKIFYITGITSLISDSCADAVNKAVEMAKERGMKIAIDPNIRLKMASKEKIRKLIKPLMQQCDYVFPNDSELKLLYPDRTEEEAANELIQNGVEVVVVKKGENGAEAYTEKNKYNIESYKLRAIASTMGAGDAFNAGFISGILDKDDINMCLKKACAMGAFAVMGYDPYLMLPEKKELMEFIQGEKSTIVR